MRTILPSALVALAVAAAPAEAKPKDKAGLWRVTNVNIAGSYDRSHSDGETFRYDFKGYTEYVGRPRSKPFLLRLSARKPSVIEARPVKHGGESDVRFITREDQKVHSFDCSLDVPTTTGGFAGIVMTRPSGVLIQWSISPVGHDCPDGVVAVPPPFPGLPLKAMSQRYKLKRFFGNTAKLPVRIDWEQGDPSLHYEHIVWEGTVTIKRVQPR